MNWVNDWPHWAIGMSEAALAFWITWRLTHKRPAPLRGDDEWWNDGFHGIKPGGYRGGMVAGPQPHPLAFSTPTPVRVMKIGDATLEVPWVPLATTRHEGPCDCGCRDAFTAPTYRQELSHLQHLQNSGVLTANDVRAAAVGLYLGKDS